MEMSDLRCEYSRSVRRMGADGGGCTVQLGEQKSPPRGMGVESRALCSNKNSASLRSGNGLIKGR